MSLKFAISTSLHCFHVLQCVYATCISPLRANIAKPVCINVISMNSSVHRTNSHTNEVRFRRIANEASIRCGSGSFKCFSAYNDLRWLENRSENPELYGSSLERTVKMHRSHLFVSCVHPKRLSCTLDWMLRNSCSAWYSMRSVCEVIIPCASYCNERTLRTRSKSEVSYQGLHLSLLLANAMKR